MTLSFAVDTSSIDYSEIVSISIDNYVNRITTITIAYNDPNQGSDYQGLFINNLTTIQGTAGATNSVFDSIAYKITMAPGKQLLDGVGEDALRSDEFKLYDASTGGNDVTETYDNNNTLLLTYSDVKTGATIELAPKGFVFPNTNKTLYIRPSRVIAEAQPATPDNEFFLEIKGLSPKSEIHPETDNTQSFQTPVFSPEGDNILWPNALFNNRRSTLVTETSATPNTKRLVQFTYKLDRTIVNSEMQHVSKFAAYSNNNYYLIREDDNVVEEASAGTYTDIKNVSKTITGPYVISDNGLTLTVNLLIDIEYITTNTVTLSTLSVKTPIDHSPDSYITGGSDSATENFVFNSKNNACDSAKNNLRWKVYNTDAISGVPKIGSFISGELSSRYIDPNAKFVNLTPPLWFQYKNPSENVYFKDFTNSKIYKFGENGAIVDIMDLCADNTPLLYVFSSNLYLYGLLKAPIMKIRDSVTDTDPQSNGIAAGDYQEILFNAVGTNWGPIKEDIFVTMRVDFTNLLPDTNYTMLDWLSPTQGIVFDLAKTNTQVDNMGHEYSLNGNITMTKTHALVPIKIKTVFDNVTPPNMIGSRLYFYFNPKTAAPFSGMANNTRGAQFTFSLVADYPVSTNVNLLTSSSYPQGKHLNNIYLEYQATA